MSEPRILIIDADTERAEHLRTIFQFMATAPVVIKDAAEARIAERTQQDFLGIVVGKVAKWENLEHFAEWLKRDRYHPPLIALQDGAESLAQKLGFDASAILSLDYPLEHAQVAEALRRCQLQRRNLGDAAQRSSIGPTGNSAIVRRLRRMIEQVAAFDTTVLITGESGTGKEVVARAVHQSSVRKDKPFVAVNCGAIPSELLESELFGHEKGAFTGAMTTRKGRFEMADGGTLFLDEIGDMSLPMQVKILRALQERTYERVGSNRSVRCDVRIIAATHRNLEENIKKGTFREDLFYRLNVFPIEMPPLRERLDDLPQLIDDITHNLERNGHGSVRFAPDALAALKLHPWPGNVRELHNLIERLGVLHPRGLVRAADLPPAYRRGLPVEAAQDFERMVSRQPDETPALNEPTAAAAESADATEPAAAGWSLLPPDGVDLKDHIANIELGLIRQALKQANGVVAHAAKLLNTRRTTLVEKLRKYGLSRDDGSDVVMSDDARHEVV